MIDDDTLRHCYGSTMIWFQLCKWLNEKCDIKVSSRLIPLVDKHTHLLIEAEKTNAMSVTRTLKHVEGCNLYGAVGVCGYFSILSAFLCCFSSY